MKSICEKEIAICLLAGLFIASCSSDNGSGPAVSIPDYTVVFQNPNDRITEDNNGCIVFPPSFGMISFESGIGVSSARYSISGTWDAEDSFIIPAAFGTVANGDTTGSYAVGFFLDDSILGGGLAANTLVLLDTTGSPPLSGTIFHSDWQGFPTVAAGENVTLDADFMPESLSARSWWPNTKDLSADSGDDVYSSAMTSPSGTAAVLSGLSTTVCTASFGAVP